MSRQVWKGTPMLAPVSPVLVSCGTMEKPNLITIGWVGIINTQPPRLSISVRPERFSHGLIKESGEFAVNLPTGALIRAVDCLDRLYGVEKVAITIIRRVADPGDYHRASPTLCRSTRLPPIRRWT